MKKIILLFTFLIFVLTVTSQTITLTLSGTVLRDSTATPVVHHEVVIQSDSSSGFIFYATRYTGTQGFYDCTIHDAPVGTNFTVRTKNCDSTWIVQSFVADSTYITRNFVICGPGPVGCVARYEFSADSLNPLHIHFFDVSTLAGPLVSRTWSFGDGGTATTGDPWHTYEHAGIYNVCLTIHTENGCTSTKCDSITVHGTTTACENWMTWIFNLLDYTFTGHTQSTLPTTYTWEFGDGTTATGQTVQHTYAAAGSYTVTLHTIDSNGCEWTRHQVIYAHNTFDLYGYTFISDSVRVDHGIAELIKLEAGSAAHIDTFEIDSVGLYHFGGVGQGLYYIRISLLPSSAYYGQYATTYYQHALLWTSAILIEIGTPANPYNVYMIPVGSFAPGNGTISGTLSRTLKVSGNPVTGAEVLLYNDNEELIGCTRTGSNGEFSFSALPQGTYKVYPEILLVNTTPATIQLNDTLTSAVINFTMVGNNISGTGNDLTSLTASVSNIYPNPVRENVNVTINAPHPSSVTIFIYSATGEQVLQQNTELHQGQNNLVIPVSDLNKGIYFVKFRMEDGTTVVRKFSK